MPATIDEAKIRLDDIIRKARVDLYKPIHIAEVLRRARLRGDIDTRQASTFQNPSLQWRDAVTVRLLGKRSTSSARYQHDVWNDTAMPPALLSVLDQENKDTNGAVERYIYLKFSERQSTVSTVMAAIEAAKPETFQLRGLLDLFLTTAGIKRSIDKAYEIVAYALLETIVTNLEATVSVRVPASKTEMLHEFADLASLLLGVTPDNLEWTVAAHVYRVGVTNAADRGLDMWANFGPAIQVKHLTLSAELASSIVDQVESDYIVIVCTDADADVLNAVLQQIGWGQRVRGVVKESDLIAWYERCLRGRFADQLAKPLLQHLSDGFKAEFPQVGEVVTFIEEREYLTMTPPPRWRTDADAAEQAIE